MKTKAKPEIFIFAGEQSGDLHGSHLMAALKKQAPSIIFNGVGGPLMRFQGLDSLFPIDDFAVMGFSDVLRNFPRLYQRFHAVKKHIITRNPAIVVFIDYPDFNLRLATALRKEGFKGKIVHYICPSVWAWKKHRIEQMAQSLDLLLTILPFEAAAFSHTSLDVRYIGNPISEYIEKHAYNNNWKQEIGIPLSRSLIAIFPGSRSGEIQRNLPTLLAAAQQLLKDSPNTIFGISCANDALKQTIEQTIAATSLRINKEIFLIPTSLRYELMRDSTTAIAKSGTVTLELALHRRPTVVVYQLSRLNWILAKYLFRINLPYYSLANIVAGKEVFPEFISTHISPQALFTASSNLENNIPQRQQCEEKCQQVIKMLSGCQASQQAAHYIQELLT